MSFSVGDHRAYHGDTDGPINYGTLLPHFVERILVAGDRLVETTQALQHRPNSTVYGYGRSNDINERDIAGLEAMLDAGLEPFPLPDGYLDAVIVSATPEEPEALLKGLTRLLPALQANGVLFGWTLSSSTKDLEAALKSVGWHLHQSWPMDDGHGVDAEFFSARREHYTPRKHAAELYARGRPDWAHDILYYLPDRYVPDAQARAAVALESLYYLAAIPQSSEWPLRLARFARARWLFSCALPQLPNDGRLYDLLAHFCEQIGLSDLARRVRNTGNRVQKKDSLPLPAADVRAPNPATTPAPRDISTTRPVRRILIIMRHVLDYGLDVLYDGLCEVLGDENVVEFPYKASLHRGHRNGEYYPCTFTRDGATPSRHALREQLRNGVYDLIIFSDTNHSLPRDLVLDLLNANPTVPVAILDQSDSVEDDFLPLSAYLGRDDCGACFKRERLAGVPYHPKVLPLPFSYPAQRVIEINDTPRDIPISWTGNRENWLRMAYVMGLEQQLSIDLGAIVRQSAYSETLCRTCIAPAFSGAGFDTARYWEVPAHGALLLAERPVIEIPHNFVDGTHCVFFDDLPDLEAKVAHFLAHPEETAGIAHAGHAHLKEFHTGIARATQLLDHVERILGGTSTP